MTIEETPFIHCIETPLGNYVFDVNTNRLISLVDVDLYSAIKNMEVNCEPPSPKYERAINDLKNKGFLSSHRPKEMRHGMIDILKLEFDNNIEQMTLQLTQACNFRCSYCSYAPRDYTYQRQHSAKHMTWNTAKAAVDFFLEHSKEQKEPTIAFYGGEPLLEFRFMKQIVEYAEDVFEGKSLKYIFTTNGSLLTRDVIEYFIKRDVSIMISLDGPANIHDASRKLSKNGQGTFEIIAHNLKYIKINYPDFYKRLLFNVVIDSRYGCKSTYEYFKNSDLFKDNTLQSTLIDDTFSMEKTILSERYLIESREENVKCYLSLINKYPKKHVSKIAYKSIYGSLQKLENNFKNIHIYDSMSHGGPCLVAQKRLFINADGDFYPCERVSETSSVMKIGNIYDGFDYERAENLLNIASLIPEKCKNCWAIAHCTICAKSCDNHGELSGELKMSQCKNVYRGVEHQFRQYIFRDELCKLR